MEGQKEGSKGARTRLDPCGQLPEQRLGMNQQTLAPPGASVQRADSGLLLLLLFPILLPSCCADPSPKKYQLIGKQVLAPKPWS
jgi:hypothetical protein